MSSPRYNIRTATEPDRRQWDPLWQDYLQFYESSLTAEVTDLLWQRIMDPAHEIQCRVLILQLEIFSLDLLAVEYQFMIDNGYFKRACGCRLYALPSRLSVDCDTGILFKLAVRIETVVAWLSQRALTACQPVFVKQTQLNRRLCIIQLSAW